MKLLLGQIVKLKTEIALAFRPLKLFKDHRVVKGLVIPKVMDFLQNRTLADFLNELTLLVLFDRSMLLRGLQLVREVFGVVLGLEELEELLVIGFDYFLTTELEDQCHRQTDFVRKSH